MRIGFGLVLVLVGSLGSLGLVPFEHEADCTGSTCKTLKIKATYDGKGGVSYTPICTGSCPAACGDGMCEPKVVGRIRTCLCGTDARESGNSGPCRATIHINDTGSEILCDYPCANGCDLSGDAPIGATVINWTCTCNP